MRLSRAAAVVGVLLVALVLLETSACAGATVGVGWGGVVAGPYGGYGPYGPAYGPVVAAGVYGRPY